jgi:alpha-glucosidase
VHPAASAAPGYTTLYEDAGDGLGYENGEYARRKIICETTADRVTIRLSEREGSFAPERREVLLELRGVGNAAGVTVNGEGVNPRRESGKLVIPLSESADETLVEVSL